MYCLNALHRIAVVVLVVLFTVPLSPAQTALAQEDSDGKIYIPNVQTQSKIQLLAAPKPNAPNPNFDARMVGAVSTDSMTVKVAFNKSMSADALNPANYSIVQENA